MLVGVATAGAPSRPLAWGGGRHVSAHLDSFAWRTPASLEPWAPRSGRIGGGGPAAARALPQPAKLLGQSGPRTEWMRGKRFRPLRACRPGDGVGGVASWRSRLNTEPGEPLGEGNRRVATRRGLRATRVEGKDASRMGERFGGAEGGSHPRALAIRETRDIDCQKPRKARGLGQSRRLIGRRVVSRRRRPARSVLTECFRWPKTHLPSSENTSSGPCIACLAPSPDAEFKRTLRAPFVFSFDVSEEPHACTNCFSWPVPASSAPITHLGTAPRLKADPVCFPSQRMANFIRRTLSPRPSELGLHSHLTLPRSCAFVLWVGQVVLKHSVRGVLLGTAWLSGAARARFFPLSPQHLASPCWPLWTLPSGLAQLRPASLATTGPWPSLLPDFRRRSLALTASVSPRRNALRPLGPLVGIGPHRLGKSGTPTPCSPEASQPLRFPLAVAATPLGGRPLTTLPTWASRRRRPSLGRNPRGREWLRRRRKRRAAALAIALAVHGRAVGRRR